MSNSNIVFENNWYKIRRRLVEKKGKTFEQFTLERDPAVLIIPVDGKENLYMINHYRYTMDRYSLEFPAGGINKGEAPIDAARREVFEEAGITFSKNYLLGKCFVTPGLGSQVGYVYVVIVDRFEKNNPEATEDIRGIKRIAQSELGEIIKKGEIVNSFTLAGLALFLTQFDKIYDPKK